MFAEAIQYYTKAQCTVSINNVTVDEMVYIAWSRKRSVVPLYAYDSAMPLRISAGRGIVQGEFAVNYVGPDYVEFIINAGKKYSRVSSLEGENSNVTVPYTGSIAQLTNEDIRNIEKSYREQSLDAVGGRSMKSEELHADILVTIHGNAVKYNHIIKEALITGPETQIGPRGEVVMCKYSFLAKDFN